MSASGAFSLTTQGREPLDPDRLADALDRISAQLREGFTSGEVLADDTRVWWKFDPRS
mgnify:CR=1 FL=1